MKTYYSEKQILASNDVIPGDGLQIRKTSGVLDTPSFAVIIEVSGVRGNPCDKWISKHL